MVQIPRFGAKLAIIAPGVRQANSFSGPNYIPPQFPIGVWPRVFDTCHVCSYDQFQHLEPGTQGMLDIYVLETNVEFSCQGY